MECIYNNIIFYYKHIVAFIRELRDKRVKRLDNYVFLLQVCNELPCINYIH